MTCWVYMVRCCDGSLYTGWTGDVEKRVATHNSGMGAKYTRSRLPVALAWTSCCDTKGEALSLEAKIKKLSKDEKEKMCALWSKDVK